MSATAAIDCDALILGTGPVAAVYARRLLAGGLSVLMADAGRQESPLPGEHLRNSHLHQRDPAQYHDAVASRLYPLCPPVPAGPLFDDEPGLALPAGGPPKQAPGQAPGQAARLAMPGAAACYGVGGMGTVWTCIAPRLHPLERWSAIPAAEWEALYAEAEEMLGVRRDLSSGSLRQRALLDLLRGPAAGEGGGAGLPVEAAPVAARPHPDNPRRLHFTGTADILGEALGELGGRLRVLPEHVACRVLHRGGRALGAEVTDLASGRRRELRAEVVIVACGALLTPQLLWASGILRDDGERSPLGRYLHDHPLAFAQVAFGRELLARLRDLGGGGDGGVPVPADDPAPRLAVPLAAERPLHGLILADTYDRRSLEGRLDDRLLLNLYWYSPVEPRFDNRLRFSATRRDLFGLPAVVFEYALAAADRELVRRALAELRAVGGRIGRFLPGAPPMILSPGSSRHYLGTTRMGAEDDGAHAADPDGRVWGFENLYVGGTGLFPVATATNPTLTACALAIRSARRILGGAAAGPAA